jgi:hypothetical protein
MNRNFFLAVGAAVVLLAAACSSDDDDGTGGAGTGATGGTGGTGGSGGSGGGCLTCNDYLTQCMADACPDSSLICEGPALEAAQALAACICDPNGGDCADVCQETCETGTEDTEPDCTNCATAALGVACSAEVSDCTNN